MTAERGVRLQPYRGLADIYDYLLAGIDYEEWADYLEQIFERFQIEPCGKILDLACGTGNSTLPWAGRGYTASGVDISNEMLVLARRKAREKNLEISFYRQDLRQLDLPFQADVAVLYQDGLNYLLTHEDLKKAMSKIRSAVRPGGYFIFNLNLVEKLPVGSQPEVSWLEEEGLTLVWESAYQPVEKIWRIKLVAFVQRDGGLFEKIEEEHLERSYSRGELETVIAQTGWGMGACYGAFTLREPLPQERNIFFIVKREG
ncbi:MAG: class I SAM-dependent DNA methyltransferase [Dethiobacteria bacterium]